MRPPIINLLLTGLPGCGKTTVICRVVELIASGCRKSWSAVSSRDERRR
jgi:nucleoside-triphosphatase THEP1